MKSQPRSPTSFNCGGNHNPEALLHLTAEEITTRKPYQATSFNSGGNHNPEALPY